MFESFQNVRKLFQTILKLGATFATCHLNVRESSEPTQPGAFFKNILRLGVVLALNLQPGHNRFLTEFLPKLAVPQDEEADDDEDISGLVQVQADPAGKIRV